MYRKAAFGVALKKIRKARNMSQEDFAIVSSRTYISSLERGLKSPTLAKINLLAETLEVNPLTLLTLAYLDESTQSPSELLQSVVKELDSLIYHLSTG